MCAFSSHVWDGCTCVECGKTRHRFDEYEVCSLCDGKGEFEGVPANSDVSGAWGNAKCSCYDGKVKKCSNCGSYKYL
jgi:hypothetical protein